MENMTMKAYIDALSSREPVPGGGGASVLGGAIGVALGGMAGSLTAGKKRYAQWEQDICRLLEEGERLRNEMLHMIQEDADAFIPLANAYKMPKQTKKEQEERSIVMEEALVRAANAPLAVMRKSMEGLFMLEEYAGKVSRLAVSDVGVGAAFLRTAVTGSALNVYTNTKLMKNRERAEEINREAEALERQGIALADRIYSQIREELQWNA